MVIYSGCILSHAQFAYNATLRLEIQSDCIIRPPSGRESMLLLRLLLVVEVDTVLSLHVSFGNRYTVKISSISEEGFRYPNPS